MSAEPENVVWLDGAEAATKGIPVDNVLESAKAECEEVVVIGYQKGSAERLYVATRRLSGARPVTQHHQDREEGR